MDEPNEYVNQAILDLQHKLHDVHNGIRMLSKTATPEEIKMLKLLINQFAKASMFHVVANEVRLISKTGKSE